jgi:hypothetical protein
MRGTKRRRVGLRRGRTAVVVAVAAFAAMAFGASSVQATTSPVTMTFDRGKLKLGGSPDPINIAGSADPVELAADVCIDTMNGCTAIGDFTVATDDFDFPPFTQMDVGGLGVNATVDLIPLANVAGNYNFATGALSTNASNYRSDVTLSGTLTGACRISPISLALSTGKTTPFLGDAFDSLGSLGPPVNGVIDADWATLPTPGDNPDVTGDDSTTCANVLKIFTDGPGGLALGNGIDPVLTATPPSGGGTTPPPAAAPPAAKKKKCKKAKKKGTKGSAQSAAKCKKKKKKK